MAPDLDIPVLRQAEAFGREYVDKRPELAEFRPIFAAIFERTRDANALDLSVTLALDDRALRRKVQALREALVAIGEAEELLYILTIEEAKAGHQTAELKRSRHTFVLHPNLQLKDFYLRKWWSSLFPNTPGAESRSVCVVYPTFDQGLRVLASQGDLQLVKHLSRSLWTNGVECDDQEASLYSNDPDEADRHLILTGNELSNHVIAEVTFPEDLPLRCLEKGITDGKQQRWADGEPGAPRTVHALVTTCKCKWSKARLWIFEAHHDRALEGVARYFADARKIESLAKALGLSPADEFPPSLQLVFTINVNRQNQLRGADGEIALAHVLNTQQAPSPAPRFPASQQEKKTTEVVTMKKRRA